MKREIIKDSSTSRHSDIFHWKGLSIQQEVNVFKVGTDSVLLASWIPSILSHVEKALDVGTGTGILAMSMSIHYPSAQIDAIDIDERAVELAGTNFTILEGDNKIKVWKEDLFHPVRRDTKYDVIICNPPYFHRQLENENNPLLNAKHTSLPVKAWIDGLSIRLHQNGHLFLVLPFDVCFEWIKSANNSGLYCRDRLNIFSYCSDEFPTRSLLHFSEQLVKPELKKICIYNDLKGYTQEYLEYSGINSAKFF